MEYLYFPTYEIPSTLSEKDAAWLKEQQGEGPLALIEVTDVCATLKVSALLKDEFGRSLGYVDANGDVKAAAPPREP
jgi:hypothetical protein